VFRVVIPARYASARLPGKALRELAGKPMVQWVYERARGSGAHEVLIATDDDLIVSAAHAFGAVAQMTDRAHASGTDRIAEVARSRGWRSEEIIVNVQGDEPLIPTALIAQVASVLQDSAGADIATLAAPLETLTDLMEPSVAERCTSAVPRFPGTATAPRGAWAASTTSAARGATSASTPTGSVRYCAWRSCRRGSSRGARSSSSCAPLSRG
jgi:3-deoxy-manno-octulosonate cytidylyltransferase (CMP-KDO synthetase)